MNLLLWGILPYIVLTLFIAGHIYRYQYDQFGWSTKSSEFLEKKELKIGSTLFHWGIIFVFGGHVMGLLIPVNFYELLGVTEHQYHLIAIAGGVPAGIAALIGLIVLLHRRMTFKRIKATTSKGDWIALGFLTIVVLTGLSATLFNLNPEGFDYRTTIAPWLRGLLVFQVDPDLMATVPVWFKIHLVAVFGIFVAWPFTRLVHVFSLPLRYLRRNYVVYRRRENRKA